MVRLLDGIWDVASLAPGQATHPDDLEAQRLDWTACDGPMPVAAALRAAGRWNLDERRDFDAEDWWYRCRFSAAAGGDPATLCFDGLATIADVWLNGQHILRSESMFIAHAVDVAAILREHNELVLCCHALGPLVAIKRPRPQWRTGLVGQQALRWFRTSLVGRIPSWCPAVAPVGPWRPVRIDTSPFRIERTQLRAELSGDVGRVRMRLRAAIPVNLNAADLRTSARLTVGDSSATCKCTMQPGRGVTITGEVPIAHFDRWWPHTHGVQPLYNAGLTIDLGAGPATIDLGRIGFRSIAADAGADSRGFGLVVNGTPVFCRGVCWTPLDIARLDAPASAYRAALEQLRDAGMNMIRIAGTMSYESDAFYDLCDELGILVWQDLMFASMDYPWQDEAFGNQVAIETSQILDRLHYRPSLAVVCGSSEIDQQAAMLGLQSPRRPSRQEHGPLADLVHTIAPAAIWVPTSPTGGTFPFQADEGVCHYYGVGAYRRSFDDARRAGVRFASECLAFSHVPERTTAESLRSNGGAAAAERWKARVPRDAGVDWDFEDVRDHYVGVLFGIDVADVRARDWERYLALGRVATGEALLRTFAEWRRPGSSCRGGLVWFARDLWPGAGWGVVDSNGLPKAAYWYLKRALAPLALVYADEGLNGLWVHAINDTGGRVEGELRLARYRDGVAHGRPAVTAVSLPAHGHQSLHADALWEGFLDLTYAYKFGPPGHDAIAATLRDAATGALLATTCYFPGIPPLESAHDLGLAALVELDQDGYALRMRSGRLAHAVAIDVHDFQPDDNYVTLEPGETRCIRLRGHHGQMPHGQVQALNSRQPVPLIVAEPVHAR